MTTKEIAKVTQGWIDGKTIQVLDKGVWYDLTEEPNWHFDHRDYRVKPSEPKLRPYASAEEFLKAQKEHGPYLYYVGTDYDKDETDFMCKANYYELPLAVYGDRVFFADRGTQEQFEMNFHDLCLDDHRWQDGTPCGIIEEE